MNLTNSSLTYPTTHLTTNPSSLSIQQERNNVLYSLTIPEKMLAKFIQKMVQTNLDLKKDLVHVRASPQMQTEFNHWVGRRFIPHQFSANELDVNNLISSIWMKAKIHVENTLLIILKNKEAFEEEKRWESFANDVEKQCHLQGHSGKFFTVRQASFLLTAALSAQL